LTLNKFWFPYDDGITLVSSELVLKGAVPYRDFIVPYPPLQYYIFALLFKIFGVNHLFARLYVILAYLLISVFAFYASYILSENRKIALFSWAACAISLVPRLGTSLSVNWSASLFAYLSIFTFYSYIVKGRTYLMFLSGMIASLAALSKHDTGIFVLAAQSLTLFFAPVAGKEKIKAFFLCLAGFAVIPVVYLIYLIKSGALAGFIESLLLPATILRHHMRIDLPAPCLDLREIFYGELKFISINQYYIPPLIYTLAAILIARGLIITKDRQKSDRGALALSLLIFGAASYSYVLYRTDDMHIMSVVSPSIILFGYLWYTSGEIKGRLMKAISRAAVYIICALILLLMIKNGDKFLKNTIVKAWDGRIIKFNNIRGSIYIPRKEYPSIEGLIRFISANAATGERILIWNKGSASDMFGVDLLVYFFSATIPASRYFIVQKGYTNSYEIQKAVNSSLDKGPVRLVVLVDPAAKEGTVLLNKGGLIDEYVKKNFYLAARIGYFEAYLRK
jgi:hypothetical protein